MLNRMVLIGALVIALPACSRRETEPATDLVQMSPAGALTLARQVADTMTGDLRARVFAELQAGGPAAAMAVCADSAQAVTTRHGRAGVLVRRVSERYRNPANEPDAFERGQLARLEALQAEGSPPAELVDFVTGERGTRELRYLRPVLIAEPCLACHGDRRDMGSEVLKLLDERYPDDRATGYGPGQLRGAVSVRVPITDQPD